MQVTGLNIRRAAAPVKNGSLRPSGVPRTDGRMLATAAFPGCGRRLPRGVRGYAFAGYAVRVARCGGAVLANTRSLVGRASGSDRLRASPFGAPPRAHAGGDQRPQQNRSTIQECGWQNPGSVHNRDWLRHVFSGRRPPGPCKTHHAWKRTMIPRQRKPPSPGWPRGRAPCATLGCSPSPRDSEVFPTRECPRWPIRAEQRDAHHLP